MTTLVMRPIRKLLRHTPGFQVSETMKGTHQLVGGSERRPIRFDATWSCPSLARLVDPQHPEFFTFDMTGTITAEGLCEGKSLDGYLSVEYFSEARIRYAFSFQANGVNHRFEGAKDGMRPWNLHRTHTILNGEIRTTPNELVSTARLSFSLFDLPAMALSFRPILQETEESYS